MTIVDDTETFVRHSFPKERADEWVTKIRGIQWLPAVFSSGFDDDIIGEAWTDGRNRFRGLLDSIGYELSFDE